jgi:hypothetical protein
LLDDNLSGTTSSVMMVILGEDLDPAYVTRALGIFPDRAWRKGEISEISGPAGDVIRLRNPSGWGGWKKFMPEPLVGKLLEDQLECWAEQLENLEPRIREFRARSWTATLDCFLTTAGSELTELKHDLLSRLAASGVDVDIHFKVHRE